MCCFGEICYYQPLTGEFHSPSHKVSHRRYFSSRSARHDLNIMSKYSLLSHSQTQYGGNSLGSINLLVTRSVS